MRGTWSAFTYGQDEKGLIPAGAGNMYPGRIRVRRPGAHPRGCGEHNYTQPNLENLLGSSPRVRGTFSCMIVALALNGLIPAGAGNMLERSATMVTAGAHPRGCGEHLIRFITTDFSLGSSPRVRGTLGSDGSRKAANGLIPAGAGNIVGSPVGIASTRAHPRGCGEHHLVNLLGIHVEGSSPRVRGTFTFLLFFFLGIRLIPAGAGNILGS